MDKVCPLCNEIVNKEFICEKCHSYMEDFGRIEQYLDAYSADMPIENRNGYCCHLYKCKKCDFTKKVNFKEVNM